MNKVCGDCAHFMMMCSECNGGWCDAMGIRTGAGEWACADFYATSKEELNSEVDNENLAEQVQPN